MAIMNNDILMIKDFQTALGNNLLNIYFYRATQVDSEQLTYPRVLLNFETNVVAEVANLQSNQVTHNLLTIENVSNMLDFDVSTNLVTGVAVGDIDSLNTAISFRLERSSKLTRAGGKRIGGLPDGSFESNELSVPTLATAIDVAVAIGETRIVSVTGVGEVGHLVPVIVGRTPTGELDLLRVQDVSGVTIHAGASTQSSRKSLG